MDFDNYPPSIDVNSLIGKVRFFKGDRWIEIGLLEFITVGRYAIEVKLPDIEGFMENQELLDDGSIEWYFWGPRVN